MTYKEASRITNKIWASILAVLAILLAISVMFFTKANDSKLNLFGYKPIVVVSGSMLPSVQINSVSIIKYCNIEDTNIGDIIVYYSESKHIYITHRIIERSNKTDGEPYVITKGDANRFQDEPVVTNDCLVGKVVYVANWIAPYMSLFQREGSIVNTSMMAVVTSILITLIWTALDSTIVFIICKCTKKGDVKDNGKEDN